MMSTEPGRTGGISKAKAGVSVAAAAAAVGAAHLASAVLPDFGLIAPAATTGLLATLIYRANFGRRH